MVPAEARASAGCFFGGERKRDGNTEGTEVRKKEGKKEGRKERRKEGRKERRKEGRKEGKHKDNAEAQRRKRRREGIIMAGMENKRIAGILRETARLLEIDGAIIGRYRSYEKAAELIDGLPESIEQLVKTPEKLEELPGIGERMVEHLQEIVKTGDYALRKKLLKKYPATILDVLQLQSLGPKKVAFLWSHFKAATVADVEK